MSSVFFGVRAALAPLAAPKRQLLARRKHFDLELDHLAERFGYGQLDSIQRWWNFSRLRFLDRYDRTAPDARSR